MKSIFDKLPRRFKNRVKLIFAAIFSKSSDLETTMASIQKPPDVVLRGWGNPYDVLTRLLPQYGSVDNDILQLADRENNHDSSEEDVIKLLYNIIRQTKSKTIIEIGPSKVLNGLNKRISSKLSLINVSNINS